MRLSYSFLVDTYQSSFVKLCPELRSRNLAERSVSTILTSLGAITNDT